MSDSKTIDLGSFASKLTVTGASSASVNDVHEGWGTVDITSPALVEVPTISGGAGKVITIKGSVNSVAALPQTAEEGDAYFITSLSKTVMWTNSRWSDPFSWKGPLGDAGVQGERAEVLNLKNRIIRTVPTFNLLPTREADGAIYVVTSTNQAYQYQSGEWVGGFPYRGLPGEPTLVDKGEPGPKGYPADPSHLVNATDWAGNTGPVYKDGGKIITSSTKNIPKVKRDGVTVSWVDPNKSYDATAGFSYHLTNEDCFVSGTMRFTGPIGTVVSVGRCWDMEGDNETIDHIFDKKFITTATSSASIGFFYYLNNTYPRIGCRTSAKITNVNFDFLLWKYGI